MLGSDENRKRGIGETGMGFRGAGQGRAPMRWSEHLNIGRNGKSKTLRWNPIPGTLRKSLEAAVAGAGCRRKSRR